MRRFESCRGHESAKRGPPAGKVRGTPVPAGSCRGHESAKRGPPAGIWAGKANLAVMTRKLTFLALALMLLVPASHAVAGKKKPKPWKSETVTIAVAHPVFYATSGHIVSVTIQEFANRCAIPASQGFDAHIFEVPAEYKKVAASASAIGSSSGPGGYDLDMFFFDASCKVLSASQASGTDEIGYMPAGTSFIAVQNYLADPNVSLHVELKV